MTWLFPCLSQKKGCKVTEIRSKNYSCRETGKSGQIPLVPPKKPRAQLPKNNFPKNFLSLYSRFKSKTSVNTHESEQQYSID